MATNAGSYSPFTSDKVNGRIIKEFSRGGLVRVHPFRWNQGSQRAERVSSGRELWQWYLNMCCCVGYFSFLLFQTVEVTGSKGFGSRDSIILQCFTALFTFLLVMHGTVCFYGKGLPSYVNNSFNFILRFSEDYQKRNPDAIYSIGKYNEVAIAETIMNAIFWTFAIVGTCFPFLALWRPQIPVFLSSLSSQPGHSENWAIRIFAAVAIGYTSYTYCLLSYLLTFTMLGTVVPRICVLKAMRQGRCSGWWLHQYVQLELLVKLYNDIFSSFFLPASENLFISLSVYGIAGGVKTTGIVSVGLGVIGVITYLMMVTVFRTLAEICLRSEKVVLEWKKRSLSKRKLRTLRPLRVLIGSFGFVDPGIILTLTSIIISNSIGMMLAR